MAGAFQSPGFQRNAFQVSPTTSTLLVPLPINCVMIGQQLYNSVETTVEFHPPNLRTVSVFAPKGKN